MVTGTVHRPAMIELRRLHRFFGSTRAVDDVSFDVYRGEVFGFIGPNGAGKTTSMRILATLDLPTAGDALVDGFSAINDPDRVRKRLGFMPDAYGVYPNVNCFEYLDFFARAYGLIGRDRHRALKHVLGFTGLDRLAEKPINGLSKGMKQRLCLGRTMIHDPAVMILDEPAAGLDPRARIELRVMINELAAAGKTILVSSHILTELAEMCDRVGIIEQGRLLAVGGVEELLAGSSATGEIASTEANAVVQIRVRVLNGAGGLAQWLADRADARQLSVDGELANFLLHGDLAAQADLLKQIVAAGFPVLEYGGRVKTLEDAFLHVTRGMVQ
jgi:ABC-2 type transport system ATP-binding protein